MVLGGQAGRAAVAGCGVLVCMSMDTCRRLHGWGIYEVNSSPLKPQSTPNDKDLGSLRRAVNCAFQTCLGTDPGLLSVP